MIAMFAKIKKKFWETGSNSLFISHKLHADAKVRLTKLGPAS